MTELACVPLEQPTSASAHDQICAICLEIPQLRVRLTCGHEYCLGCIRETLARSPHCPLCRVRTKSVFTNGRLLYSVSDVAVCGTCHASVDGDHVATVPRHESNELAWSELARACDSFAASTASAPVEVPTWIVFSHLARHLIIVIVRCALVSLTAPLWAGVEWALCSRRVLRLYREEYARPVPQTAQRYAVKDFESVMFVLLTADVCSWVASMFVSEKSLVLSTLQWLARVLWVLGYHVHDYFTEWRQKRRPARERHSESPPERIQILDPPGAANPRASAPPATS